MASVTLTRLWLNLASDPSRSWSFAYITGLQSQPAIGASSAPYAAGNYRMSGTPGRQSQLPVTLTAVSRYDRYALEFELPKQLLCVRDDRGRKFYGYYSNPQATEHLYNDECDMTLTFLEVAYSETL
jgi:hypothetical protein